LGKKSPEFSSEKKKKKNEEGEEEDEEGEEERRERAQSEARLESETEESHVIRSRVWLWGKCNKTNKAWILCNWNESTKGTPEVHTTYPTYARSLAKPRCCS
jgi:hypothetical protein